MKKILFYMTFILSGCAQIAPLSGSAIVAENETIKADHHVSFERKGTQQSFRTHLEIKHDAVVLIGLGVLGEVLFECQSRGPQVDCKKITPSLPAKRLFANIQYMIWSADTDERFTSTLVYEDEFAQYRLQLKPLDFKRGKHE